MKKLKVIIAVLMCSVIIIVGSVPASALVGELTLGTGALLGIVITGLLASGVAISSSQGLEATAQAVFDTMTPQMQQRIAALKVTEVGGQLLVHWTAQTWNEFSQFVGQYFSTSGATSISIASQTAYLSEYLYSPSPAFSVPAIAGSYNFGGISIGISDYKFFTGNSYNLIYNGALTYSLGDGVFFYNSQASSGYFRTSGKQLSFTLSFPFLRSTDMYIQAVFNDGQTFERRLDYIMINGVGYILNYFSNAMHLQRVGDNVMFTVSNFYSSVSEWIADVLISNHFVGVLPGTDTYIQPETGTVAGEQVTATVFPNQYVGDGTDSLPDVIPDGTSIAIPIPGEIVGGDTVIIPDIPGTLTDTIPQDIIKDVTIDTAIPDVAYPDIPELPDDGSEDSPDEKANKMRFPAVAKEKFPFCIPFDFFNAIQMLSAPARIPEYDIPFVVPSINFRYNVHLDFSDFETVAKVLRWFLSAGWILTLILITKSIIK